MGFLSVVNLHSPRPARVACTRDDDAIQKALTDSVRQHLQADHPLVAVQLQAIYAVEAVIFDQVQRGVDGDLVQHRPLPLGRLTW